MKRSVAIGLAAGAAAIVLATGILMPRARRRAHTYALLDSLAALPLGTALDSLRRVFPRLYCPAMEHHHTTFPSARRKRTGGTSGSRCPITGLDQWK